MREKGEKNGYGGQKEWKRGGMEREKKGRKDEREGESNAICSPLCSVLEGGGGGVLNGKI